MVINKKGQGMETSTIILLFIGVIIAIIVILGVTGTFGSLSDVVSIFKPATNMDNLVTNCNLAMGQAGAFCEYKYVKLDGKVQYVNCFHPDILSKLDSGAPTSCAVGDVKFCENLRDADKDIKKTIVNSQLCVEGLGVSAEKPKSTV